MLPFFIDGASQIEPGMFWHYFLIYDQATGALMALASVFEAHITSEVVRAKVSQVLVLPPYQRLGLGTLLYSHIYDHYRFNYPKCIEIIVEDSADDFQAI